MEHREHRERPDWLPAWAPPGLLLLDPDHAVEFITYPGQTEPYGFQLFHRAPERAKGWCLASVRWRDPEGRAPDSACWQLVSRSPLHVEPSILCGRCHAHGFIRDGLWVPA